MSTETDKKLAKALGEAGMTELAELAGRGYYSDFASPLETPKIVLVEQCRKHRAHALAERIIAGEFDG